MRLLVVEDESELATLMRRALELGGFAVDLAPNLAQTEDHLVLTKYDVVILDLALPDGDGLSFLRRLRERRPAPAPPVLVLTACDGPEDRVVGLDAGADDYLVKPFHMPELLARLRGLLRRPNAALGVTLGFGNLVFDTTTQQGRVDGIDIGLSVCEAALLELLLRRQSCVVTREALEKSLYSFDTQLGSNAMEVLVHRLRRRLTDTAATPCLHTVRGVGYLLSEAK